MEANIVIWGAMIIAILFLIAYRKRDVKPPKSRSSVRYGTVKSESYCPKCGRFPETSVIAKPVENFKDGISVNFRKHCLHCGMIFDGKIHYVGDIMDAVNFNSEFIGDWNDYCEKYKGER